MPPTEIYFVTSNEDKFNEIRMIASEYGVNLKRLNEKPAEIQSDNLEEIANYSLIQVLAKKRLPVFVEDTGLFIETLKGFPGPYSSYVFRTVSFEGILKLTQNIRNRRAYFLSVIAYCEPPLKPILFTGKINGVITFENRGSGGFGFDPIFLPHDALKTFAELTIKEKNLFSHRAKAVKKLFQWICRKG